MNSVSQWLGRSLALSRCLAGTEHHEKASPEVIRRSRLDGINSANLYRQAGEKSSTDYLNKRTGEFVVLPSDDSLGLEDEDDYAEAERGEIDNDWLGEQDEEYQEQYKLRREIIKSRDYILLPDRSEIHEWQIMDDFCRTQKDPRVKDEMLALIRGRGAFGRFHSAIQGFELESLWYEFREAALSEIAVEWLDANQIEFVPLANAAVSNSSVEAN